MKLVAVISLFVVMGCGAPVPANGGVSAVNKDGSAPLLLPRNTQCFPRKAMEKLLSVQHDEHTVSGGVMNTMHGKFITSLFISKKGTWTLVVTNMDAISCIMAYGSHWQSVSPSTGI